MCNSFEYTGAAFARADGYFAGIFDGRGYTIDKFNSTKSGYSGLFYQIGGTVRNIGFTNAIVKQQVGGILGYENGGRVENVYVQLAEYEPYSATYAGSIVGQLRDAGGGSFKNVMVDLSTTVTSQTSINFLRKAHTYAGYNNVYMYGAKANITTINGDVAGAYADLATLKSSVTFNASDWSSDCWKMVDGVPAWQDLPTTIVVDGIIDVEGANGAVIDLTKYASAISGEFSGATASGLDLSTATFANNKLTIPANANGSFIGDTAITLNFSKDGEVKTTVKLNVAFVTLIINDAEEFNLFSSNYNKNGYYVLGNSFKYTGTWSSPTSNGAESFVGTFDGRGYTIDGFATEHNGVGLVHTLGSSGVGTIKNIAFTNAIIDAPVGGIIGYNNYGVIENVFVSVAVFNEFSGYSAVLTSQKHNTIAYTGVFKNVIDRKSVV